MKNLTIAFVAALTLMTVGCKKKGGSDAMAKMTEFKDKMCACKDTACAQKVSEEMTKWSADMSKDQKEAKPSEEDQKKGAAIGEELGKCMQKAMGAGGAEPAGGSAAPAAGSGEAPAAGGSAAPAAAGNGDLPSDCNDYKAAIEKLSTCDKMPQAARDALKNAFDQASASWASLPAEAKAGLATACKAGADAVMQSAKATCGW